MVRPVRWLCFPVGCVAAVAMIAPPAPTAGTGLGGEDDDSRFLSIDSLDEARELEARLRAGADRARAASVIIIIRGDRQTPGATGSGTIISSDGWIVTAGHVGDEAGRPCEVRLEDGTKLQGMTAGMVFQGVRDWGLLKVDPKGQSLPFVSMVDPEPLPRGSWLCVHGHTYGPELDAWTPPALRIGRVLAQNEMAMLVDAPFASGDSGGGVFTIDGDLIGIVSSAGELVWQSTATSLRPVLPDLDRLKAELPAGAFATM
ncbi:MAG: serine protease, partial [Planctomycetota bacterium]|nr:serine protease [Planctomycetota bacterium]